MSRALAFLTFTVIALAAASTTRAQTGPGLLLDPLLSEEEIVEGRADAMFFNNGSTDNLAPDGDNEDFGLSIYTASGRIRERREAFIPRLGWNLEYYDLDTDDPGLPGELLDTSVAFGVDLNIIKDWRGGLTIGGGYAGDLPFNQGDAWYGKATLIMGKDLDKQTTLALVLDYDGSRTFLPDVPIPGFAYRHQYDPTLSFTLGVPLNTVIWKPTQVPRLRVELSWLFLETFEADVDYEILKKFIVFGRLSTINRAFHTEQIEGNNRLLFFQRRVEVGLRWQPREETTLSGAIGYAWGGEFSAGFDTRDADAVADLSDEPYLRIGFETRF